MVIGIVGAGTRLRVILHAKDRLLPMGHRCHGAVVEIEVRHLDAIGGETRRIQGKTMVLTRDFHLTGGAAGMVETTMSITELEGGASHGQTENLMAKANTEQREIPLLNQTSGQSDTVANGGRITRSVG